VDIGAIVFPDECGLVVDFWELRDVLDEAGVKYK
jgi:hypothetical protein